jgi:nucleoside 2-deoxyribosyltransferase
MFKVYVASSLLNHERVSSLIKQLESYGIKTTYDWTKHARDILNGTPPTGQEELSKILKNELDGVFHAEIILCVMPGRTGTHFEMGYAYANHKDIIYFNDQEEGDWRCEPLHYMVENRVLYLDKEEELLRFFKTTADDYKEAEQVYINTPPDKNPPKNPSSVLNKMFNKFRESEK